MNKRKESNQSDGSLLQRMIKKLSEDGPGEFLRSAGRYIRKDVDKNVKSKYFGNHEYIVRRSEEVKEIIPSEDKVFSVEERESPPNISRFDGFETSQRRVYTFSNAKILENGRLVQISDKYFVPFSVGNTNQRETVEYRHSKDTFFNYINISDIAQDKLRMLNTTEEYDSVFLLGGSRSRANNPYNPCIWFSENLPLLRMFFKYQNRADNDIKIAYPGGLNNTQIKSLEYLGINIDNVIQTQDEILRANQLVVPEYPLRIRNGKFDVPSSDIQWVRDSLISKIRGEKSEFSNMVYVSRGDASRRRVLNENEVVGRLEEIGFEKYDPGKMTLEDEIILFNEADIIVGTHGANMAGVVFAEDSTLIELFPEGGVAEHFFVIANELDLGYDCLLCDSAELSHQNARHRDIHPNIDKLTDIIEKKI